MPELPEVETLVRGLRPVMAEQWIVGVEIRRPDLRFPLPDGLAARLRGQRVKTISRRAKYGLLQFYSEDRMLFHLGMAGRMRILSGNEAATGRHQHLVFALAPTAQSPAQQQIVYEDARRFGFFDWLPANSDWQVSQYLRHLGPEPLDQSLSPEMLSASLAGRKMNLKAALLDQRIIAGIGNIYASEALFRARLSPRRRAASVKGRYAERLLEAIQSVLSEAIAAGGSSLRDHRQADGTLGYFQHSWQVYGREGEPCLRCSQPVQRLSQQGRSTFFCSRCQR